MSEETVQMRQKGVITLPVGLRRKYGLREGDVFSLIDLGDGSFVLSSKPSAVTRLGDAAGDILRQEGLTTEDMLQALEDEREQYYREHYLERA